MPCTSLIIWVIRMMLLIYATLYIPVIRPLSGGGTHLPFSQSVWHPHYSTAVRIVGNPKPETAWDSTPNVCQKNSVKQAQAAQPHQHHLSAVRQDLLHWVCVGDVFYFKFLDLHLFEPLAIANMSFSRCFSETPRNCYILLRRPFARNHCCICAFVILLKANKAS